ncbi:MAG TPA: helix-turn-helix transcriptional regulator [Pseudogracilibacillus sp.]|nr:helix-turn-helix transcriptional regulator [Pseudogracilibacillus sp.]
MIRVKLKDNVATRLSIAKTGKSLRGFSKDIGISHAYLSQILNKKRSPSSTIAHKIANGLNKEIEDIFLVKTVDITTTSKEVNQ